MVAVDFKQYWFHRWKHHVSWWWPLHRVHHFNEQLTAIEHARTSIPEYIFIQALTASLILAVFGTHPQAVLYGYAIPTVIVAGLFSHANLDFPRTRMPWWGYIVSTPNAHAVHHHKATMRFNYGEVFVLWDVVFGTWKSPIPLAGQLDDFGAPGERAPASIVAEQLLRADRAPAAATSIRHAA